MPTTARIAVSMYDHPATHVLAIATQLETIGVDAIWLGEHVLIPMGAMTPHPNRPHDDPPIMSPDAALQDPLVLASAICAVAPALHVATGVFVLPLRHPLLVARSVATVQEVSGGRLSLGVGAGWLREEFHALELDFRQRGRRLDEALDVIDLALAGGAFEYHGEHFDIGPVQITPVPVDLPIVVGGTGDRAIRRAALRGDGWYNPTTTTLRDCVALRERIESMRAEAGRSDRPFTYHIRLVGPPTKDLVRSYLDEGFDQLSVSGYELWPRDQYLTLDQKLEAIEVLDTIL